MALKDNAVTGLFIGLGAAVLAPAVLPVLASVIRPLTKAAIKGGIYAWEQGRVKAAEMSEFFQDMAAEAKVEMSQEKQTAEDITGGAPAGGA